MPSGAPTRVCEFGPFRYDPAQRLLFRAGVVAPLPPKAIDTLHVLIERRGQIVEKADLMRLVWPDCTVEEVGLARNISLLRKALGDDQGQFIATIPKRGYRFVAPVVEVAAAAPVAEAGPVAGAARAARVMNAPASSSATRAGSVAAVTPPDRAPSAGHERAEPAALRRPRRLRLWLIAAAALALIAGLIDWQFYHPSRYLPAGEGFADVAVLPLDCLSPEARPRVVLPRLHRGARRRNRQTGPRARHRPKHHPSLRAVQHPGPGDVAHVALGRDRRRHGAAPRPTSPHQPAAQGRALGQGDLGRELLAARRRLGLGADRRRPRRGGGTARGPGPPHAGLSRKPLIRRARRISGTVPSTIPKTFRSSFRALVRPQCSCG